jgi:hypothetical protein
LFFSWYIKNKQFKPGGNLSGQITPFLLVVIVIMLIAALAVIQIGKVALDNTFAANAADAGSLAAASSWAAALNNLAYTNYDLRLNFDSYRDLYKGELLETANYYLSTSMLYSSLAAVSVLSALVPLGMSILLPVDTCCLSLIYLIPAALAYYSAGQNISEAKKAIQAYQYYVDAMKTLTIACHDDQLNRYYDIRHSMQEAYVAAKKAGFRYAFLNSGITSKLSNAEIDVFNEWLAKDGFYKTTNDLWRGLVSGAPAGAEKSQYVWITNGNQRHVVSVTIALPNISSYILRTTQLDYLATQIKDNARTVLVGNLSVLYDALLMQFGVAAGGYAIMAAIAVVGCVLEFLMWIPGVAAAVVILNLILKALKYGFYIGIGLALFTILTELLGQNKWELWLKEAANDLTFETLDANGNLKTRQSSSNADAAGLMIVSIEDINLENNSFLAKCCTTQTHPTVNATGGISSTTTTRCSTSTFGGGSMVLKESGDLVGQDWLNYIKKALNVLHIDVTMLTPETQSAIGKPVVSDRPELIEALIESTVNANYAPEITNITVN